MVTALNVYLVTNGNGKEAVEFYKDAFNAEITNLMFWKDGVPDCPKDREDLVMNAQMEFNGIRLQLSDENPDFEYKAGGNMSAALIVDSIEEAQELYAKLTVNAQEIVMELQEMFWSPAYANFIDQFGIMWQINTELAN
ncbi:VOC family protein [Streptococcus uberis]|uniref:Bleomycin resistance protein n=2 Tax=Streptococcus TaxID=1301 RepID=A0A2N8LBI6_9STRE|nr:MULTISPECIES: VOC family protein [Streptococcus]MCK1168935.1 VOC family protein [Streptococcus uberis]MCK1190321.1 VOC family protein [Streptococcus uberis]MCK1208403.1 VOC family protein [Streptococcus uberis]MCK1242204.1 VOC family protein [Streptococcus uberis]MTB48203.1 VOC family protein [Streptococcus uberis]